MKTRFALITFLCACLVAGCTRPGHLFPIQGPLAAQTPPPIYTLKLTARLHSGSMSAELSDGRQVSGQWKLQSVGARAKESSAGVAPPFNLSAEWDTVYGPGFYTANVLGADLFIRAALIGKQSSALKIEIYSPRAENADTKAVAPPIVKGVAKDEKGNVYKVAF